MQTKLSKDIPELEWNNAPTFDEWMAEAQKVRSTPLPQEPFKIKTINPNLVKTANIDFDSCRPINLDHAEHFSLAKGLQIVDVGVQDGCIFVNLLGGELNVDFADKKLEIEPHANGEVIDYHIIVPQKLKEVFVYKPNPDTGITSCIFVIRGENKDFEYLLTPSIGTLTFSFHLEFNHA